MIRSPSVVSTVRSARATPGHKSRAANMHFMASPYEEVVRNPASASTTNAFWSWLPAPKLKALEHDRYRTPVKCILLLGLQIHCIDLLALSSTIFVCFGNSYSVRTGF